VIAHHRHRAVVDHVHDRRHHPIRIGAVADIVAEQHRSLGATRLRIGEAGLEGLTV
jgi:hypothetical protein